MAKQTFTTGQVLTAAQMTSLQQTAMGGGSATAKTASYVLVAADAGTTVAMNAAGATTITVNTGLFSAGDTVFIQNLGVGSTTITAGSATVSTAGSLILPQYDAGILYFTATGAAIFYDYIQVGAASPLTTKGDLYGYSTSDARIPIGANDTVLTADSTQSLGLKWAAPSSGSMTLINSGGTGLSGSLVTISSIPATYKDLKIVITNYRPAINNEFLRMRVNLDTSITNYSIKPLGTINGGTAWNAYGYSSWDISQAMDDAVFQGFFTIYINDYKNTTTFKVLESYNIANQAGLGTTNFVSNSQNLYYRDSTTAINSVSFLTSSGNMTSGTAYIYGVN